MILTIAIWQNVMYEYSCYDSTFTAGTSPDDSYDVKCHNIQINVIISPEMELPCRTIKIDRYYNYAGRKPIRLCKGPCYNARVMYVF